MVISSKRGKYAEMRRAEGLPGRTALCPCKVLVGSIRWFPGKFSWLVTFQSVSEMSVQHSPYDTDESLYALG